MNRLSSSFSYRVFRSVLPGLFVLLAAFAMYGCKEDENVVSTSERDGFLEYADYGLYVGGTRTMICRKYEHQLVSNPEGTMFRLQTDNLSQVVSCTFSVHPAHSRKVEVTLRTVGIPKAENGTFVFTVEKTADGKCWLWSKELRTGLIVPGA